MIGHIIAGAKTVLLPSETIFLAILIESLPFVLVGSLVSSVIHVFVPEIAFTRWLPKRVVPSVLVAGVLGFLVPVCDCGTMPVTRSLLEKGVNSRAAVAFTLAAPTMNPVTLIATYCAFGYHIHAVVMRAVFAYSIACVVGFVSGKSPRMSKHQLRPEPQCSHRNGTFQGGVLSVVDHCVKEFFGIIGFLVVSAAVASVYQVYRSQHVIVSNVHSGVMSVLTLMLISIVFSLCSEADAFVARSFAPSFGFGSILAFMLIGQMADLRNLFLLPRTFGARRAMRVVAGCCSLTLLVGICF